MNTYDFSSLDAKDICAIDFETPYEKGFLNVRALGNVNYSQQAPPYMVSIYCPARGVEYVGPVKPAPWDKVTDTLLVSHNAGFDLEVLASARGKHRLVSSKLVFAGHECSSDLSAYCGLGRSLEKAVLSAYGVSIDKRIRINASGKKWPKDFKPEEQEAMLAYCLDDSKYSYRLWTDYRDQWPIAERAFAGLIRCRCRAGIFIDTKKMLSFRLKLELIRAEAEGKIPWEGKVLSLNNARKYCQKVDVPPPPSFAEKNPECAKWEKKYGPLYPFVEALHVYRKSNMYLKKIEKMGSKLMKNGRMNFNLRYHGAEGTGRLAGSDGLNIQNLPRADFEGIDFRSLIVAARGKKLIVSDFAQIEPRVCHWIVGNLEKLNALRNGVNIYEMDAQWQGEPGTMKALEKDRYQKQKAITLGLSYGMGAPTFMEHAASDYGVIIDLSEARMIVERWRAENPLVRKFWSKCYNGIYLSFVKQEPYTVTLPSGRVLSYFDIIQEEGDIKARVSKSGNRYKFYGAKIFENIVQAIARDCLRDAVLRIEQAGIPVAFSAHDEVVIEIGKSFPKEEVTALMLQSPAWASTLPLGAETIEVQEYTK
jgi:DNA polymerase family A